MAFTSCSPGSSYLSTFDRSSCMNQASNDKGCLWTVKYCNMIFLPEKVAMSDQPPLDQIIEPIVKILRKTKPQSKDIKVGSLHSNFCVKIPSKKKCRKVVNLGNDGEDIIEVPSNDHPGNLSLPISDDLQKKC